MTARTATHSTAWAHTPERSNRFMLRLMTWISLRLGRRAARGVLHLVAAYFLLFAPASRRASRNYLQRALGRPVLWRDLYRHFFTFAATIHDRVYLVNRRFDLFDFEVHGEDTLRRLLADGSGLFLMGAHLGSFEVIRALARKDTDLCVAMVMHEDNAQKINAMLAAINPQAVQDIIGLGHIDSMLKVRERLDEGCALCWPIAPRQRCAVPGAISARPLARAVSHGRIAAPAGAIHDRRIWAATVMLSSALADFSLRAINATARNRHSLCRLTDHCRQEPYNWLNFSISGNWPPTIPPKHDDVALTFSLSLALALILLPALSHAADWDIDQLHSLAQNRAGHALCKRNSLPCSTSRWSPPASCSTTHLTGWKNARSNPNQNP